MYASSLEREMPTDDADAPEFKGLFTDNGAGSINMALLSWRGRGGAV